MDRGTYAAASAGMASLLRLQIVSNNLANAATPGYKRQVLVGSEQSFEDTLAFKLGLNDRKIRGDHERVPGVVSLRTETDFSQGPIVKTGNDLDVALTHEGDFFVINTPSGEQYTRAGNFSLSDDGRLVTSDGFEVRGDGGAITIPAGGTIKIYENGSIRVNGEEVARLRVVRFDDPSGLKREGSSRFSLGNLPRPRRVDPEIVPRSLEMANVSVVGSMVSLIAVNRGFESYTKVARAIDEMNRQSLSRRRI
ncbi:MAG: flagellar hook-basal body protein [Candidatus Dadabacteria bacterium]|nr:MAG: flagellar hook-basal body protein [Candidatus Dadabacteria bacterium]